MSGFIGHPEGSLEEKQAAIKAWNDLADSEDRAIELGIALSPETNRHNADLYRKTARSIQHEIDTGVAVCVCCWKPFGRGMQF